MNYVLVVALGNPGKDYAKTRHNLGWMVADEFRQTGSWSSWESPGGNCVECVGNVGDQRVVLMKPMTMMNSSGDAVLGFISCCAQDELKLVVVHDELDLPFGEVRTKFDGGAAGHRGVKDVIRVTQTPKFHRVRCGIGHPEGKTTVIDHVLGQFTTQERESLPGMILQATLLLKETILSIGSNAG